MQLVDTVGVGMSPSQPPLSLSHTHQIFYQPNKWEMVCSDRRGFIKHVRIQGLQGRIFRSVCEHVYARACRGGLSVFLLSSLAPGRDEGLLSPTLPALSRPHPLLHRDTGKSHTGLHTKSQGPPSPTVQTLVTQTAKFSLSIAQRDTS